MGPALREEREGHGVPGQQGRMLQVVVVHQGREGQRRPRRRVGERHEGGELRGGVQWDVQAAESAALDSVQEVEP